MKPKKSNFTLLKTLSSDLSAILNKQNIKRISTKTSTIKTKTSFPLASHHKKNNSININHINFINTDAFKNISKQNNKLTDHTGLDSTKISTDTATTNSKRNVPNILQSQSHKNYMQNFVLRLNKSLNKNKSNLNITNISKCNRSLNTSNNISTLNSYLTTEIHNIDKAKEKKKKTININNKAKILKKSKSISEQLLSEVNIVNHIDNCIKVEKSSGSIISEESAFSSKQRSISGTNNSSLKALSNKQSSHENTSSFGDEYVSYTVSDDEVTCRSKMNINNYESKKEARPKGNIIDSNDFNSFCKEMNMMLFNKIKK